MHHLRRDYTLAHLHENNTDADPFIQFKNWFNEAVERKVLFPDAMTLSSVSAEGTPDARVVLLKQFDHSGFVFFTNHDSPTGQQLDTQPHACAVFWWSQLERQVRIRGDVNRVSDEKSDAYFQTRPRAAQLGAWCSSQSDVIPNREFLDHSFHKMEQRFHERDVPRPPNWGGYNLTPREIEFWQGGAHRLHDRIRFRCDFQNKWIMERLAP